MHSSKHPPKIAEIEYRRNQVAALYLNRMTQPEIVETLKKKGIPDVSQSTVSRDIKFLKNRWREESEEDIKLIVARENAELDRMELELAALYQMAKKIGDMKNVIKLIDQRLHIKDRRMRLLGLDKLTSITIQKLLDSEKTSDDKIIELKEALLESFNKV